MNELVEQIGTHVFLSYMNSLIPDLFSKKKRKEKRNWQSHVALICATISWPVVMNEEFDQLFLHGMSI